METHRSLKTECPGSILGGRQFFFISISSVIYIFSPIFTRECNETSIAGSQKALTHSLTHSLDFVNHFIYGNYNVPYYNAADQCIRLSPW